MAAKSTSFRLTDKDLELFAEGKELLECEELVEVLRYCVRDTIRRLRLERVTKPKIVDELRKELVNIARTAIVEHSKDRARRLRQRRSRTRGAGLLSWPNTPSSTAQRTKS